MAGRGASAAIAAETRQAPPAGSLRENLRKFTVEKLLKAAMVCFAELGYKATSVERIVEIAGTTAPTFYRHFPSKSDLLIPLREYLTGKVAEVTLMLDGEACRSLAGVRAWCDTYFDMWRRVHRLCDAFWEAAASNDAFAAGAMPEAIATVRVMTKFFASVPPRKQKAIQVRLALMVMFMDRLALAYEVEKDEDCKKLIADEFAKMLWETTFAEYA